MSQLATAVLAQDAGAVAVDADESTHLALFLFTRFGRRYLHASRGNTGIRCALGDSDLPEHRRKLIPLSLLGRTWKHGQYEHEKWEYQSFHATK